MEHYHVRSHSNIISVESIKKYDDIRFVDLTFLLNWTSFFSKVMDKQVQLGVKGPHTNHCFIFEARDVVCEDESTIRQVVTSCKRYMSPSGKDVPMILPDLMSNHWKDFKKIGKKQVIDYDPDNCSSGIQDINVTGSNTLLGLRCFKVSNDIKYIFNVLSR